MKVRRDLSEVCSSCHLHFRFLLNSSLKLKISAGLHRGTGPQMYHGEVGSLLRRVSPLGEEAGGFPQKPPLRPSQY
jgi:hypothetical protein